MDRAKKFYEEVLHVQLSDMPMPHTVEEEMKMMSFPMEIDGPGAAGALVKMVDFKAGGGGSTIVYFDSDDCAIEETRIEEAGGKVHQSKESIGEHGFIVLAFDTEENIFGVHSSK